jgi:uncharacterized protein (TIGR02996 family)
VGGIIYGVFRTIRGLPGTTERVAYGRGWGGVSHDLFPLHATHGIADDGSPSGLEHAVVYLGNWGPVLQLRARWYDRAAARRFRDLLRADAKDELGHAITRTFQRFVKRPPEGAVPYPAVAFDLDVIHALAASARDHDDLLHKLKELPRESLLAPYALPAEPFRSAFDLTYHGLEIARPVVEDAAERALIAEVCATPGDPGPAHVYADWLDERGRSAEAEVLRPLVHTG